jgi:hypothetical protein
VMDDVDDCGRIDSAYNTPRALPEGA